MSQVPHERAMVERLKEKPFVLLGVNGDESHEQANTIIQREKITWRSFWKGGPNGPITDRWNMHF